MKIFKRTWQNYITSGFSEENLDLYSINQIQFINTFSLVGILSAFIFGLVNVFSDSLVVGIFEISFGSIGVLNLIFLRKTGNYRFSGNLIIWAVIGGLIFLLIKGGLHRTGALWYFTFPPIAYFLRGIKQGTFYILLLIFGTLFTFVLYVYGWIPQISYNIYEIRQILAVYLAVSFLVVFYEKVRRNAEKKIKENEKEILLKNVFQRQFEDAGEIQRTFIPENIFSSEYYDIVGYYHPALEIGGDYIDFFPLEDGRMGIIICDVSSKGIPAALIMVKLRTIVKIYSDLKVLKPGELFVTLNQILINELMSHMFVTSIYMILDHKSGTFEFSNAGHEPLIYYSSKERSCHLIESEGLPVGISPEEYKTQTLHFNSGDIFLTYTDGITDMENRSGEMYGRGRLHELLTHSNLLTAKEISEKILEDVHLFSGGKNQVDDIALIVVKIK